MKILVLNGSPKKRSDTMVLTNSFLSGIRSVNRDDINIEIINVIEKNIKPCLGCFKCWENKNARCVIDDDQNEIIQKYIEADVIIFSFPLYGYAVPSHLKAVMDRFIPLNKMTIKEENGRAVHEKLVDLSKKQAICIVGSGFPNFNDNFAGLRIMLDNYFLKKEINIFVSETPMLNVKEAEPLTINLKNNMFIAGKEFIESGSISKELIKKIEEPMLDFNTYTNIVNSL